MTIKIFAYNELLSSYEIVLLRFQGAAVTLHLKSKFLAHTNLVLEYNNESHNLYFVEQKNDIFIFHSEFLMKPIKYTLFCRAVFGDLNCTYNKLKQLFKVIQVQEKKILFEGICLNPDIYRNGLARFIADKFVLYKDIDYIQNNEIILKTPIYFKLVDRVVINSTCDKSYAQCKSYNNEQNFYGEPKEFFNIIPTKKSLLDFLFETIDPANNDYIYATYIILRTARSIYNMN